MAIDPEMARAFIEHLHGLKRQCPHCDGAMAVMEEAIALPVEKFESGRALMCIPLSCENCGYTALFQKKAVGKNNG